MKYKEPLITLQATPLEVIALGSAIIGYIRLVECTVKPSRERTEVIEALLTFQKRLAGMDRPQEWDSWKKQN